MREIKFRAWISNTKHFLDPVLVDGVWYTDENLRVVCPIVEQFTGLTDKNGVEIYEGDIVNFDDGDGWVVGTEVVKFKHGAFSIACEDNDMFLFTEDRIIEVIGNIHENHELLEKKP